MSRELAGPKQGLGRYILTFAAATAIVLAALFFEPSRQTISFVFDNLVEVAPLVAPGIFVAGWVNASGAGDWFAWRLTGNLGFMIVAASAIGALTPVCGAAVLPLMVGLLASGVPLAPVMAFWLSSPITDPALIAATAATLGIGFATGTTLAAFALGLLGGFGTWCAGKRNWAMRPLRRSHAGGGSKCAATCDHGNVEPRIWLSRERMLRFRGEVVGITRLILICLIPAFAAEHLLRGVLDPEFLGTYLGEGAPWSIPIAVFLGSPLYIEGFVALPLVRSLVDHGMSHGAAMAFLVSGGAMSVWGIVAIAPVLKLRAILMYAAVAVVGSLLAGLVFELFA